MYEITYSSIVKKDINKDDIKDILSKARIHNSANGVTGCLLYYNKQFIQILEGEKEVIKDLLKKIEKDERHFNIRILAESEKEDRTFKKWTMAYKELSDSTIQTLNESLFENNFLTFSELADKPTRVIRLFWEKAQRLITDNNRL